MGMDKTLGDINKRYLSQGKPQRENTDTACDQETQPVFHEPPSLARTRLAALLPRVVLLETVRSWG